MLPYIAYMDPMGMGNGNIFQHKPFAIPHPIAAPCNSPDPVLGQNHAGGCLLGGDKNPGVFLTKIVERSGKNSAEYSYGKSKHLLKNHDFICRSTIKYYKHG